MKNRFLVVLASLVLAFAGLACEMPEQEPMESPGQEGNVYDQPADGTQDNGYQQEMNQGEEQQPYGSQNEYDPN
ncbi:MAG: hypothetical protein ACLFTB_00525 [Desulfovibrionales bacterium]